MRRRVPDLGARVEKVEQDQVVLLHDSPLSPRFKMPFVDNNSRARNLVLWMLARQKRNYRKTIEESIRFDILVRNAKLLFDKYDFEWVVRATRLAAQRSEYPYSFKFVEALIPEVIETCQGYCSEATREPRLIEIF